MIIFLLIVVPRASGMPHVKIGVVGTGTASIFEETLQSSNRSLDIAFVPSRGIRVIGCMLKLNLNISYILLP